MPTRKVKLTGLGYWAKVFEDFRDLTGFEDALKDVGGQTCIDVDLDDTMMEKLKRSKSMKRGTPSPDNEGLTRVRFTRKWQEKVGGGAPVVVKADGTTWEYDEEGSIGNGSTVEILLSVYDTSRKSIVGTRLDKVKVTEHLPYSGDDDDDEEEEEEAPPPKPAPKAKAKPKPAPAPVEDEDDDDEIPF
jgi:hypothetical protein